MESRVNDLEECFKEAEKRLDEVDKKVDAVFQEAEDVKNGGKGGAYAYPYPFNLPDSSVKIKLIRSSFIIFRIIARGTRIQADSESFPNAEVFSRHQGRVQVAGDRGMYTKYIFLLFR